MGISDLIPIFFASFSLLDLCEICEPKQVLGPQLRNRYLNRSPFQTGMKQELDSEWDYSNLTGVNVSDLIQYISGLKYSHSRFLSH